jgi:hypothetical protein
LIFGIGSFGNSNLKKNRMIGELTISAGEFEVSYDLKKKKDD